MFAKLAVVLSSIAVLVAAIPTPASTVSQCNTGSAQCCNTVSQFDDPTITSILGPLLGITLSAVDGTVGLGCTPISALSIGEGVDCSQKPVCCQGNKQNGLVNIQCSPISL